MKDWLLSLWTKFRAWIVVPGSLLILAIVGVFLLSRNQIKLGGLLGLLWGQDATFNKVTKANTIPEGRVDASNIPIPLGVQDTKGMTQAPVVPLQLPGIFESQDKVQVVTPGKTIDVPLPVGVSAKDVASVIIATPTVGPVTVENKSPVTPSEVDELVRKYGAL